MGRADVRAARSARNDLDQMGPLDAATSAWAAAPGDARPKLAHPAADLSRKRPLRGSGHPDFRQGAKGKKTPRPRSGFQLRSSQVGWRRCAVPGQSRPPALFRWWPGDRRTYSNHTAKPSFDGSRDVGPDAVSNSAPMPRMASQDTVPKGKIRRNYDPSLGLHLIGIALTNPPKSLRAEEFRSSRHKSTIGLRVQSCLLTPIRSPRTL